MGAIAQLRMLPGPQRTNCRHAHLIRRMLKEVA
jgi:hypothetical protein